LKNTITTKEQHPVFFACHMTNSNTISKNNKKLVDRNFDSKNKLYEDVLNVWAQAQMIPRNKEAIHTLGPIKHYEEYLAEIESGYPGIYNYVMSLSDPDLVVRFNRIIDDYNNDLDRIKEELDFDAITWQKDFWRTPVETLKDKTGDCEDMALLLISMLESYNKRGYEVWTLSIVSKVPEYKGHMAVAFPVQGGKLTILDPAGNYYTGIQYGSLRSDSESTAINNWLAHWATKMPGAIVDGIFSENLDKQFSTTAEFLTWLSQR